MSIENLLGKTATPKVIKPILLHHESNAYISTVDHPGSFSYECAAKGFTGDSKYYADNLL